jgi:DNA-binding FadR family transcriptional regulator
MVLAEEKNNIEEHEAVEKVLAQRREDAIVDASREMGASVGTGLAQVAPLT